MPMNNNEAANSEADDAQSLAERVGAAMLARDAGSQMLDIAIEAMAPGFARVAMAVRNDMLNGHQTCHGGLIFTLADSAFAFACNSDNQITVGAACTIDYLRPGRAGDVLVAEAEVRSNTGRTGVYDITVRNQNNETVALFRGRSHRVRGEVLDAMQTKAGRHD